MYWRIRRLFYQNDEKIIEENEFSRNFAQSKVNQCREKLEKLVKIEKMDCILDYSWKVNKVAKVYKETISI